MSLGEGSKPGSLAEDAFEKRHIGPSQEDQSQMLKLLGVGSLQDLISKVVPQKIRSHPESFARFSALSETAAIERLRSYADKNQVYRSFIGLGYYGCITPGVIQRNILENPGWYTQYTPYQAEIAQGRLEALLNFQTMVCDLTGLPIANASLLDEGTAAAEACGLSFAKMRDSARSYFVSSLCHPQTIALVKTRAEAFGLTLIIGDHHSFEFSDGVCGALVQYPATDGSLHDYARFIQKAHTKGALVTVATDLLALTLLKSPGEFGADMAVGSAQRFGVPMGFGGPHAAFFACRDELKRLMPGRLVGVSKDAAGKLGLRLSLQTREQHIRREKATSNICTAQVLLAVMAGMYAVYHGPHGLKHIARRVHTLANAFAKALRARGFVVSEGPRFDTVRVHLGEHSQAEILKRADQHRVNLRIYDERSLGVSFDETSRLSDVATLVGIIRGDMSVTEGSLRELVSDSCELFEFERTTPYLTHAVFNRYHSETEFLRYVKRLESRDLSLGFSMIPLGSCTMKLNATAEMVGVSWPEFCNLHPFAPAPQSQGYRELFKDLEQDLRAVTGFDAVSLQPNSGAQGEYAGLLVIKAYHEAQGNKNRTVCLIPRSAHGTNPASAAMAGLDVVVVECDSNGNIDVADLRAKAKQYQDRLACLMVTYPSTHGVFEESIKDICQVIHECGGQVYMDGANLNALVGLCRPVDIGADVCHINLHKTFCIPHGGGGPGMGPIAVRKHLSPFLPTHPLVDLKHDKGVGPVSAAPWGSALILVIPWVYIRMMGSDGLRRATEVAILNANYIAKRLEAHYPTLYSGANGFVAHECILDLRKFKHSCGVEVVDVAKRLIDYGFHAPTVSWPVAETLMVEPTESESKAELDRFCEAMISIRTEIAEVEAGQADRANNVLKHSPHTAEVLLSDKWDRPYSRERAAYPAAWTRESKFWPAVGRIDSAYGDKHLVCSCPPLESY